MASKKAEAIKRAKAKAAEEARWKRLELLVLALAEKAGIDVEAVLSDLEGKPIVAAAKELPKEVPAVKKTARKRKTPTKKDEG